MGNISRAELPFLILRDLKLYTGLINAGCKKNVDLGTLCALTLVNLGKWLINAVSPSSSLSDEDTKTYFCSLVWRSRGNIGGLL